MRGIVSKLLLREARSEYVNDRKMGNEVHERHLVERKTGEVVNHPFSIRGLYRKLKHTYTRMRSHGGIPKLLAQRIRRPHKHTGAQPDDRIAHIQKPLMFILGHCQPSVLRAPLTGEIVRDPITGQPLYKAHPIYESAVRAAKAGRGDLVQKMARQFLPA